MAAWLQWNREAVDLGVGLQGGSDGPSMLGKGQALGIQGVQGCLQPEFRKGSNIASNPCGIVLPSFSVLGQSYCAKLWAASMCGTLGLRLLTSLKMERGVGRSPTSYSRGTDCFSG